MEKSEREVSVTCCWFISYGFRPLSMLKHNLLQMCNDTINYGSHFQKRGAVSFGNREIEMYTNTPEHYFATCFKISPPFKFCNHRLLGTSLYQQFKELCFLKNWAFGCINYNTEISILCTNIHKAFRYP